MAALLDISAVVPEHRLRVFSEFITRFQEEVGLSQRVACRRCTIALIKSLRARTATAKKNRPMKAFRKYTGDGPHYITPKSGSYQGVPLHSWTMDGYKKHQPYTFIYAAENKHDAWKRHAKIRRHGLAKASWGWFMKSLFRRSSGDRTENGRLAIDGRMVEGSMREIVTGQNPRTEITIVNKLDYITQALSEKDIAAAVSAANDSLLFMLNNEIEKASKK